MHTAESESKFTIYESYLSKLEEEHQYCTLQHIVPLDGAHVLCEDKKMLNFSSNDYLNLSQHQELKKNAIRFLLQHGVGTTTSFVVNSHLHCHGLIEEKLALLLGKEAVHLFNSRYQANMTVLATLANPKSLIFIDRSCHNGLYQGAAFSKAKMKTFEHNDLVELEQLLEKTKEEEHFSKIIVTESIFSLEGDLSDLKALVDLAKKYQALLFVDDSHAIGVMGHEGMGLTAHVEGIDVVVGTFSKACGTPGAYLACNKTLKKYLINTCPGLRDTSLPPAILGAIDAALDLIPQMEGERKQLEQRAYFLRKKCKELGILTRSASHLIPIIIGSEEDTREFLKSLTEANILATPLFSPLVPENASRIRISINAQHSPEHLTALIEAFPKCSGTKSSGDALVYRSPAKIVPHKVEPFQIFENPVLQ